MNEIRKKLFRRILTGFVIGIFIGVVFFMLGKGPNNTLDLTSPWMKIRELIFCGLYGSACIGGTLLYRIDRFSRILATVIHLLIIMGGLFLLGLSLGWKFNTTQVGILFAAYFIAFVMIWITMYLAGKNRARKMNKDLQQWKSACRDLRSRQKPDGND